MNTIKRTIIGCAVFVLLSAGSLFPQDYQNIEQVSKVYSFWDRPHSIAMTEDYCYVGTGESGLQVVNITDYENPTPAGNYLNGTRDKVLLMNETICTGDWRIFRFFDISEPDSPELVSSIDAIYHDCMNYNAIGNQLVISTLYSSGDWRMPQYSYKFEIFDLTNSVSPQSVFRRTNGFFNTFFELIALDDDRIYVTSSGEIWIFDLNQIDELPRIGRINIHDYWAPSDILAYNNTLFLLSGRNELVAFSLDNLDYPEPQGVFNTGPLTYSSRILIAGDLACVSTQDTLLEFIDISDLANISRTDQISFPATITGMGVTGNLLSVVTETPGLTLVDLTDAEDVDVVGAYDASGSAAAVEVNGNTAYIAAAERGLGILDITDPANPVNLGFLNEDIDGAFLLCLEEDYLYVVNQDSNIVILGASDAENPLVLGWIEVQHGAVAFAVRDEFVYILDAASSIQIYDISDMDIPRLTTTYSHEDFSSARCIELSGDYAYIGCQERFVVVDLSDFEHLQVVGGRALRGKATDIEIEGDNLYICDSPLTMAYDPGLWIFDISDPIEPAFVSCPVFRDIREILAVDVKDGIALAVCGKYGIHAVNVANPREAGQTGYIQTDEHARDIAFAGNHAITANQWDVRIYDCSAVMIAGNEDNNQPTTFDLLHVYPNPFNNECIIKYTLQLPGIVDLRIYDTNGRLVRQVYTNKSMTPGQHSLMLKANDLQTGVYMLRMSSLNENQIAKIVLLR